MTTTQRSEPDQPPRGPEQFVTERASKGSRRITMWTERNTSSGRFPLSGSRKDRQAP